MTAPITVGEQDLRALAAIVSQDRPDVPAKEGLPPSLLADLIGQIRCDVIAFGGFDSGKTSSKGSRFPTAPPRSPARSQTPSHIPADTAFPGNGSPPHGRSPRHDAGDVTRA